MIDYDAAALLYPDVAVEREAFAAFVAAHAEALAAHAGDLLLACGASRGDAAAITEIERAHIARLPELLAAHRLDAAMLDEVRQATRTHLFVGVDGKPPRIAEYAGRGPLGAWLRIVALRVSATERRKTKVHDSLDDATRAELVGASPEHQLARARWQGQFDTALRAAFAALEPDERALFRFQFAKQLTLDQIATVLGVHRATAARRIAAAREKLWAALTDRLRRELRVSQDELADLLGEWRSKLELSLSGILAESKLGVTAE